MVTAHSRNGRNKRRSVLGRECGEIEELVVTVGKTRGGMDAEEGEREGDGEGE